jgi:hypothetical protein
MKSDAKTHRTPKAFRAKCHQTRVSYCDSFGCGRASWRRFRVFYSRLEAMSAKLDKIFFSIASPKVG